MSLVIIALGFGVVAGASTSVAELDYRLPPSPPLRDSCRPMGGEEIVICGRRDRDRHRLGGLAPPAGMVLRRPSPFEWDLGDGVRMLPIVSEVARPDGLLDRRIMIEVRIPF